MHLWCIFSSDEFVAFLQALARGQRRRHELHFILDNSQILLGHLTGHDLVREAAEDRLRMIESSAIDELYVLEDDKGVQGLWGFRIRENVEDVSRFGEVSLLVTNPAARRVGHGRALMAFAEQLAKNRGCKGTWLVSGFGREEEAHSFYAKLGYQVTGYQFVTSI